MTFEQRSENLTTFHSTNWFIEKWHITIPVYNWVEVEYSRLCSNANQGPWVTAQLNCRRFFHKNAAKSSKTKSAPLATHHRKELPVL